MCVAEVVVVVVSVVSCSVDFKAFSTRVVRVTGGVTCAAESAVFCCWILTVLPVTSTEEEDLTTADPPTPLLVHLGTVVAVTMPLGNVDATKYNKATLSSKA